MKKEEYYQTWLAKLRKRAQPSGALSQWSLLLAHRDGGDAEIWREHLRAILEEEEKASPDLILDLDLITAPPKENGQENDQVSFL